MSQSPTASRRGFLRAGVIGTGAVAASLLGCRPETASDVVAAPAPAPAPAPTAAPAAAAALTLPDGLDPRNFVIHGLSPMTLETRRDRFGAGPVTPASRLFVRNNLPLPPAEIVERADDWEVEIAGVGAPRSISLRELKTWGTVTMATVLQCSGNGRAFFAHETSGSQWGVGAAGCVVWGGVPLRTVVQRLGGALDGLEHLTSTGGEELPEGVDRDAVVVERSIPRAKALDDVMLAWEMNGEPIPLTHGGPLRVIVPGYFGVNNIKYVKRVAFTAEESTANIMSHGYRFRPIGESGDASQPSMLEMDIKSWINEPSGRHPVAAGPLSIRGYAFSGGRGVQGVEVSLDGGATWQPARLDGPDMGVYAWRTFVFDTEVALGTHTVMSRATDLEGHVQPELRVENHRGYGHNGWRDAGVTFEAVEGPVIIEPESLDDAFAAVGPAPGSIDLDDNAQAGRALFTADATPPCGTCHTLSEAGTEGAVGPNLTLLAPDEQRVVSAVTNGVGAMPPYGGTLTDEQIAQIAHYVRTVAR